MSLAKILDNNLDKAWKLSCQIGNEDNDESTPKR